MLTSRITAHSQTLTGNRYCNGHSDLIEREIYTNDNGGWQLKTVPKAAQKALKVLGLNLSETIF